MFRQIRTTHRLVTVGGALLLTAGAVASLPWRVTAEGGSEPPCRHSGRLHRVGRLLTPECSTFLVRGRRR